MDYFKTKAVDEQQIVGGDFSRASLSEHCFTNCTFQGCNFTECLLWNAKFISCSFKSCNLSLLKLDGCRMQDAYFEDCKIVGADFFKCEKNFFSIKTKKSFYITVTFQI